MKTITVNYRNHEPQTFQYSSILQDIEVNVKYKDSRGYCIGTSNGEKFFFAWLDKGDGTLFLEDWTNDGPYSEGPNVNGDGAPKRIKASEHIIEVLMRKFTGRWN